MENRISHLQDRVVKLEELVSHQQHLVEQLDQVVTKMQAKQDELQRSLDAELARVKWLMENSQGDDLPHEKPPHY